MTHRYRGRFVRAGAPGEAGEAGEADVVDTTLEKLPDAETVERVVGETAQGILGIYILVATIITSIIIIVVIIPAWSYKPTMRVTDLEPQDLVIVPNRYMQLGTDVHRLNRITGDRTTVRSQDLSPDEIVLAPRRSVTATEFMGQGDCIPVASELLDRVPWMERADCRRQCEERGYLVACD